MLYVLFYFFQFYRFTTEFNGNIYIVSICNSIKNLFYDPEQLVGAAKSTADGHSVVLGRIDRSDIIVNGMVLFYISYCYFHWSFIDLFYSILTPG